MVLSRFLPAALSAATLLALGASATQAGVTSPTTIAPDRSPTVIHASRYDVSAPMRDILKNMPPQAPMGTEQEPYLVPNILLKPTNRPSALVPDYSRMQLHAINVPAPAIDLSFEGISSTTSGCGCLPPDTNGDVSDTDYIQWVNLSWQIFDKTTGIPNPATPSPRPGNSFFVGFGGKCETTNSGDPIALWDSRAQRWIMSQFVTSSPYGQCVAVSTTSDPLGTYFRYEFHSTNFGDYPKLAVWTDAGNGQDAYLLTTHEFDLGSGSFLGAALSALQRDKILAGDPTAAMVHFGGYDAYGVQPVNLTGTLDAPGNACPSFVHFDVNTSDYLFWDLCLDWTTPANSTISTNPTRVAGAPFAPYYNEVPQPGTTAGLDSFGSNVMYRASARAFPADAPTRISLVINHVVMGDVQQAGINWVHFNLDDHGANPAVPTALDKHLFDEGTYVPDSNNRWLGGIAIDGSGDIGVGYSKSSSTIHPQVEISGRTLDDVAGTLRDEQNCTDTLANGSQTSTSNRWGDYSAMSVDPVDQCTFYYTNEYYPTTAPASWHTRVCSFKFASCGSPNYALVADSPKRIQMCGPAATDPTYSLRVGVLNGFNGSVLLTGTNLPAGTTAQFSSNTVTAPGSSTLTLAGGAALPSGEYNFGVDATSGALTRNLALQLGVSSNPPSSLQLVAPTDNAAGVKILPLLSWSGMGPSDRIFGDGFDGAPLASPPPTGALNYTVEVATDYAFANIVATATVTTTSWKVGAPLNSTTKYYWRVTAHNYCGDGPTSATFSFTTGVPGQCPAGSTATTLFQDDFQNGANGWTTNGSGAANWAQMAAPAGIGLSTTVWGITDNATTSDRGLISPSIALPSGTWALMLSFDTYHSFEVNTPTSCWDNGTMEIKAGSGAFSYLDGSRLFTDPYDGIVAAGEANAGAMGWCHAPATAIHSIVDLDGFDGQSVNLRWRAVTDSNGVATTPVKGMYIDNVKVEACQ
jgi:hypothetical protein